MAKKEPIIILEDDADNIFLLETAFKQLGTENERRYFSNGEEVLQYLRITEERPFIIISNVQAQKLNGIELRARIQEDEYLRRKAIPFVFLSEDTRQQTVAQAYELTVQGFFAKQDTVEGIQQQLETLIHYWKLCRHPNS